MTPLRSLLFIPGNKHNMLEKAFGLSPDAVVPDMEDSVPDGEKAAARTAIQSFLPRLARLAPVVVPRVNALGTPWIEDDLAAVVGPHVFGVSVGKIDGAEDVSAISQIVGRLERRARLEPGSVRLILWIETARAVVNCYEICKASRRIVAVAFGAEDFTHDMQIERLDDESQLVYARSALCTAARAAGVLALETPYFKLGDTEGLEASSARAKGLGFKGRFAIHPAQIEPINRRFSPSEHELEQARRIVAAYEAAEAEGRGSTSLDGRVVDVPVVKRARALLALAEGRPGL